MTPMPCLTAIPISDRRSFEWWHPSNDFFVGTLRGGDPE